MPVCSHSRLNTFENGSLQYRLHYIDRIERDRESTEVFLGNHAVLQVLSSFALL